MHTEVHSKEHRWRNFCEPDFAVVQLHFMPWQTCCRAIIAAMLSDGTIAQTAAQAAAFRSMSGVQGVLDPKKRQEMVRIVASNCYVD